MHIMASSSMDTNMLMLAEELSMASESVFDGLITAEWKSNASLLMLAEDLATYPDLAEFRRVADSLREWMEVPESEWPASWPAGTHTRRAGCEVRCLRELARTLEKRLALDAVAAQLARVRATAAAMAAVEEHVPKRQRGATSVLCGAGVRMPCEPPALRFCVGRAALHHLP